MATKIYRTTQGDCWDSIAYKIWPHLVRSELYAHNLMAENPEYMDVLIFPAGVELRVPEAPIVYAENDVPPWRV